MDIVGVDHRLEAIVLAMSSINVEVLLSPASALKLTVALIGGLNKLSRRAGAM